MRIQIIYPGMLDEGGSHVLLARESLYSLTPAYLAALLPDGHEVTILDDSVERIDFDAEIDAVMLTTMSCRAERAYQIAAEFRKRGKPVVMGGIHASLFTEEASRHVDAVVVGEAENIMAGLVRDLEVGSLKPRYQSNELPDLTGLPTPRYDLIRRENYWLTFDQLQVLRGCPHRCRYCTVSMMMGTRFRRRPISDVLRDLEQCLPIVFFIDDNFFSNRKYSLELLRSMKGMGKLWGAQGTTVMAFDDELLDAAVDSGFTFVYIGIETINKAALEYVGKGVNIAHDPGEAVDRLSARGVSVWASMIVGFDGEGPDADSMLLDFLEAHKVPFLFPYILTPPPGTDMYRDLEEQGRILKRPWRFFDGMHATFKPKNMSAAEMEQMYWRLLERFYSPASIMKRTLWPPHLVPFLVNIMFHKKMAERLHPCGGMKKLGPISKLEPLMARFIESPSVRRLMQKTSAAGRKS